MSDDLFDSLLNLEDEYYQEAFAEGFEVGRNHSIRDGKQFGYQIGFQRFAIVGAINGVLTMVKDQDADTMPEKKLKTLNELIQLSDSLGTHNSNSDDDVAYFEGNFKALTSKTKVLLSQLGYKSLYSDIQSTCTEIAGTIPSTQINSANDMADTW